MPTFDTIIKGGTIVDGTRSPRYAGDIGIKDGKIAEMGKLRASDATKVLDAHGLYVVPGFVDPGSPTLVPHDVVVPGARGDAFVADFELSKRLDRTGTVGGGIVLPTSAHALAVDDVVSLGLTTTGVVTRQVIDPKFTHGHEGFYSLDHEFPAGVVSRELRAYFHSAPGKAGIVTATDEMELEAGGRSPPGGRLTSPGTWSRLWFGCGSVRCRQRRSYRSYGRRSTPTRWFRGGIHRSF